MSTSSSALWKKRSPRCVDQHAAVERSAHIISLAVQDSREDHLHLCYSQVRQSGIRGMHIPPGLTARHLLPPRRTATGKIQRRHVRDKFVQDEAQKAKDKRQAKL